jgi:ribose/xylose/arabinose/galactoside ABC-type transport system permease subunit
MFSGFALRYAVAILGLLAGFKVLRLSAEPMIAGFILMIVVQVLAMTLLRPQSEKREA